MTFERPVVVSPWVRAIDLGTATVLVDVRGGGVQALLDDARRLWGALAATGELGAAASSARVDRAHADRLAAHWIAQELVTPTMAPRPWPAPVRGRAQGASWGTRETLVSLQPTSSVPWRWRLLAAGALLVTLTVRHAGPRPRQFARLLRIARAATWRSRPADAATVATAVRAVRNVARVIPARIACLEESIAAVLTLAAVRRAGTWCHGVAGDPVRLHAWMAVNERPIEEPASTDEYTPILRISRDERGPHG